MKLISFYLPQFHEIPENNDAWGSGFTEWTNVKKSMPLYAGHHQPKVPLHDNYYNLLDVRIMEWQSRLAQKAGIYGFCFYHYWFQGRMVLEKPVKNWLEDKSIKTKYCFCWANESWTKTWHGAGGNKEILIPQDYGKEEEWQAHYNYFREYFLDDRYIKEDNRPFLLIYRLKNIPQFNQMIQFWNMCAQKDGFDGIFLISMNVCREHAEQSIWVNAAVDFEPNRTKAELLSRSEIIKRPVNKRSIVWNRFAMKGIRYDKINRKMLAVPHKKNHFRTVFVNYDDTPRRHEHAVVMRGVSPKKFGRYLRIMMKLSRKEENQYLFINAWNEWGEGNYLEPDMKDKYAYLSEIRKSMYGNVKARSINLGGRCETGYLWR